LIADRRDEFRTAGLLRLEGAFPRAAAEAMGDRVREFLASRDGILRGERSTWTVEKPAGFQSVTRSGAFWAVGGDRLGSALDALFGAGRWARPRWWGRPLVTFPAAGPWELPAQGWPFDFMPASAGHRPVQFFAFLSPVRPRGGGTLVLTGSHRLVAPYLDGGEGFRMPRVRASLAAHPWLRGLWEPGHGGYHRDATSSLSWPPQRHIAVVARAVAAATRRTHRQLHHQRVLEGIGPGRHRAGTRRTVCAGMRYLARAEPS
jgi:hypothetical protein